MLCEGVTAALYILCKHAQECRLTCRYNGSPIMDAVRHKHSEVVAFLKRNGAVLHHDKAKGMECLAARLPAASVDTRPKPLLSFFKITTLLQDTFKGSVTRRCSSTSGVKLQAPCCWHACAYMQA